MDRQKIKIASPCSKNFDEMEGEGHRRFCDQCEKHVHNLSDLTKSEALSLLKENANTSLCVVYTFDASNRVRFRDDLGFKRPSKAQLGGIKRLLAAAAMVPLLAMLPACDTAPEGDEIAVFDGYQAVQPPCDLPEQNTFTPIDEIIKAEQRFVQGIKELLGFVPEYEMVAGEPMIEPDVYEPEFIPEPYEPLMGAMAYEPEIDELPVEELPEPEPEPEPEPQPIVIPERMMMMGDVAEPSEVIDALERETDEIHEYIGD